MIDSDAKVARGVAALYLANVSTLILNTLFLVLLANLYASQQDLVGLVSFLNVVVVSAATLSVLALPLVGSGVVATPPAVARFVSSPQGTGGSNPRRVYLVSLGVCTCVSLVILLLSSYFPVSRLVAGPSQTSAVFYAAVDATVYSFAQLGAYTLLGAGKTTTAGKIIIGSGALRYSLASVLILNGSGPSGVFIGFAGGDLFLALAANLSAWRSFPTVSGPISSMRPVLAYMVSIFFAALMGLAVSQTDKFLAFVQLGLPPLAIYNIATVGAAVASFAPSAATNVLVPALGGFANDQAKRLAMLRTYTRHISLTAIPIGFELAAVSPFILRLFGDPYAAGAPVMAVIAIAISVTAVASVYTSGLLSDDRAHHFAASNLLGLAGLVAVAFLTVPVLGSVGIALGRATMLGIMSGSVVVFVRRRGMLVLDSGAYTRSLLASALTAILTYLVLSWSSPYIPGRVGVVAASVVMLPVGIFIYLAIMKAMRAYNEDDMDFIDSLIPKRLRFLSKLARKLL